MLPGLEAFLEKSSPGCYDDPAFRPFETKHSTLAFEGYAQHVLQRKLEASERTRVSRIVPLVLNEMIDGSSTDEIRARCYPFCVAVMKALEACGVWNFMLIGSTQFTFPNGHTRSFVLEPGSPGHAWLVVPPFKIVDPTARFQHWQNGEDRLLPKWIASKRFKRASKEKLFEPSLLPSDDLGPHMDPRMPRFWKKFPPGELTLEQAAVYYQPYRVAIPRHPAVGVGCPHRRSSSAGFCR